MSPAHFTPEKQCYTVLILQFFRKTLIQTERVLSVKGKSSGRIAEVGRLGEVVAHKAVRMEKDSERERKKIKSAPIAVLR
jgi:hypothetical protein